MSSAGPGRMVCPLCTTDEVSWHHDGELESWIYECPDCKDVDGHYAWIVADGSSRRSTARDLREGTGIMARLGLHDALLEAIGPGTPLLEFGVVEYRYAYTDPDAYRELLERYGHVAITGGARNTASWMIGRALWALYHNGELVRRPVPATGRWRYLRDVQSWALPPGPQDDRVLSWEEFADGEGFDPEEWPPLNLL
jgi:hypothetical protein